MGTRLRQVPTALKFLASRSARIELHDGFRRGCSAAFRRASAGFGWEERRGEDTFISRVEPAVRE